MSFTKALYIGNSPFYEIVDIALRVLVVDLVFQPLNFLEQSYIFCRGRHVGLYSSSSEIEGTGQRWSV